MESILLPDPWPLPQSSEIDLLNLEDLYAIGRRGLRGALVIFVALSIGSLVYLDTSLGLWGALVVFAMGLGLALFLLLRPAQEVRSLIRAAKREELAQLKLAVGDANTILERIAEYRKAGASKFVLIPLARGDADLIDQTQRLISEVIPVAHAWC